MARSALAGFLVFMPVLALALPSRADGWPGRPVVVVGVDGATWDVIDPMMERGELPNFRRLVERGARSDLIALPPPRSPVIWTTIATGTFPSTHGIVDFVFPYVDGVPKQAVQSTQRRVPAIWNVATDAGRSVGIVGYYATHPAEVVNGFMISDVLLQGRGGSAYPADLLAGLDLVDTAEEIQAGVRKIVGWDYDLADSGDDTSPHQRAARIVRGRIDNGIVQDENVRRAALNLQHLDVDLFVTYFRIVDHTSHAAWIYYDDTDFTEKPDPAVRKLLAAAIPNAYRWVDAFLGDLMGLYGEDVDIVVVSDHGFGSATGSYALPAGAFEGEVTGNHRPDGILLAAGPDIRHGTFEHVSHMDVAPLLLALLGLPVSDELPGRVPVEQLGEGFLEASPVRRTSRYAIDRSHVTAPAMSAEAVDDTLQQLKSLGYIDESTTAGRDTPDDAFDFWSIDPKLAIPVVQGEILFHLMRHNPDEVDRLMRLAAEHGLGKVIPLFVHDGVEQVQSCFSFEVFPEDAVRRFEETYMPRSGMGAVVSFILLLGAGIVGWRVWRSPRRRSA